MVATAARSSRETRPLALAARSVVAAGALVAEVVCPMRQAPEYKPPPVRLMVFVRVPRAVFPRYVGQRWADVLAAARAGDDGLEVVQENYYQVGNRTGEWAMLRESPSGGCYLFRQNWIEPDAIVYAHFL